MRRSEKVTFGATGTCFDDAVHYINQTFFEVSFKEFKKFCIVHAILKMKSGKLYSHCWVESPDKDFIIEAGVINNEKVFGKFKIKDFYNRISLVEKTTYSIKEFSFISAAARDSGCENVAGPFKWEYLKLCKGFNLFCTVKNYINEKAGKTERMKHG